MPADLGLPQLRGSPKQVMTTPRQSPNLKANSKSRGSLRDEAQLLLCEQIAEGVA